MKRKLQGRILTAVLCVVLICVFITLILHFLFFTVRQKSVSMEPTVPSGSCLFVSCFCKKIKRGDLVLLNADASPKKMALVKAADSIASFFTGQKYFPFSSHTASSSVRRVVALPGDTIYMTDYVLYIKPEGQPYFLTEFEYMQDKYAVSIASVDSERDLSLGAVGKFGEITLKNDEYFVLGDNRNSASDSRLWGPVSRSEFTGRVLFKYFPFTGFKIL